MRWGKTNNIEDGSKADLKRSGEISKKAQLSLTIRAMLPQTIQMAGTICGHPLQQNSELKAEGTMWNLRLSRCRARRTDVRTRTNA